MIRIVLWDIDGTLLDFPAAERGAIRKCFELFQLGTCTDAMLQDYSAINEVYWKRLERGEMAKKDILVHRFIDFFTKYSLDTAVAPAFNAEYQVRLGDFAYLYEGAKDTILTLKAHGIRQVAVTNGTKVAQVKKLRTTGLDALLDEVCISEDIGAEKPNPAFFAEMFRRIGTDNTEEMLIVGDSLTSDIQGGINVGIKTCWFHDREAVNTTSLRPDYEIRRLADVLPIVLG